MGRLLLLIPFTRLVFANPEFAELSVWGAVTLVADVVVSGNLPTGGCCGRGIGTLPFGRGTFVSAAVVARGIIGLTAEIGAFGTLLVITGTGCGEAVVLVVEEVVPIDVALTTDPAVVAPR